MLNNRNRFYYLLKPFIPRGLQILIRRRLAQIKRAKYKDCWPIDKNSCKPPVGWTGWPDKKRFALVLTHDVETENGHDKCKALMKLEKNLGFKSSFNFVPTDYKVSPELRLTLTSNGFEVGVHGLTHDGSLYKSREIFLQQAKQINQYLKEWKSVGFRSPSMYHNLDWLHDLNIEYDASTFDTDPFEPQPDGMGTIFPFWVKGDSPSGGYVELPYTLSQDFTALIIFKDKELKIWKEKLEWIVEKGGMALLNVHPDYINFGDAKQGVDEYPVSYYVNFLNYINKQYKNQYWHVLPREMASFWRDKWSSTDGKMVNSSKI